MKTSVKRRPFGNTGLKVSEISFGAMNLRMLPDNDSANKLINDILDTGINLIDTARAYDTRGYGNYAISPGVFISSEIELGKAISARTDIDEPLVIVTKGHGYTPQEFDSHLAESRERLQIRNENGKLFIGKTEIILVYLTHGIGLQRYEGMVRSGLFTHANKMREEGLYHFLGFSSHYGDSVVIQKAIESGYYQVCELPYNIYNISLGEGGSTDLIKLAYDEGLGIINMKAFGGGGMVAISEQLSDLTGIGYAGMARFCISNPYISTIDAGVTNIEEFLADIHAASLPRLSAQERVELRERSLVASRYLDSICRECMHCMEKFECPQSVDFPRILGMHGRYTVSKSLGFDISGYKSEYEAFDPPASGCIACGECNEWCEYQLDIPDMLETAAHDFE
ncbi:MAG: aldo/keto reductase [Eubacteriaceae bacterium]|nr:aldo/keto reductase [Eubacteriaceae bacterium]